MPEAILLLLHTAGCLGFTLIVTFSKIAKPVRELPWPRFFAELIHCPMCFGTWAGAGWGLAILCRDHLPLWLITAHDVFAFACTVSLLGYLSAAVETHCALASSQTKHLDKKGSYDE